jgi:LEA14-like dessication related protein
MKNLLFLGGAAAALLYFLRQKKAAGENLRVEPVDIAIDSARSSSSFWTRIYYNIKLKLINTESASVNVSGINLNVLVNDTPFGSINNTTGFIVNAGSERIVNLEASFSSLGIIQAIRDLIADGLQLNVKVSGYVDTDLGRIAVNFSKNVGGSGMSGKYEYKVTDCMDSNDCQIEIDSLLDYGNKPFSKLTQSEKSRYFKLKKRQEKFQKQGK